MSTAQEGHSKGEDNREGLHVRFWTNKLLGWFKLKSMFFEWSVDCSNREGSWLTHTYSHRRKLIARAQLLLSHLLHLVYWWHLPYDAHSQIWQHFSTSRLSNTPQNLICSQVCVIQTSCDIPSQKCSPSCTSTTCSGCIICTLHLTLQPSALRLLANFTKIPPGKVWQTQLRVQCNILHCSVATCPD
jgi:hypothetical protein